MLVPLLPLSRRSMGRAVAGPARNNKRVWGTLLVVISEISGRLEWAKA